jgi:spore germination protein GerM
VSTPRRAPAARRVLAWVVVLAAAAALLWWTQVRPQPAAVSVFFTGAADGATTLVAVSRPVTARGPEAVLRAALDALLAGPTAEERARGLSTEIPAGTRLLDVRVREGLATVDLSEAVASGGGSHSMRARLWQIVYTATQHPSASQVQVLVEGQERPGLGGEGVVIDRPIGRPPVFPRF